MIDGSEKRNRWLNLELQRPLVIEKRSRGFWLNSWTDLRCIGRQMVKLNASTSGIHFHKSYYKLQTMRAKRKYKPQ